MVRWTHYATQFLLLCALTPLNFAWADKPPEPTPASAVAEEHALREFERIFESTFQALIEEYGDMDEPLPRASDAQDPGSIKRYKGAYEAAARYESLAQALESIEGSSPEEAAVIERQVFRMMSALVQFGKKYESLSPDEFLKKLGRGEIALPRSKLGQAELNWVDGIKMPRIVHDRSNLNITFERADLIPEDSRHRLQYIAGQHLFGGRTRQDGELGRDQLSIRYTVNERGGFEIEDVQYFPRALKWSRQWLKDQWIFTVERPDWRSKEFWILALPLGGIPQFVSSYGVERHLQFVNSSHEIGMDKVIWTACFGTGCGMFYTTIRRFVNRPGTSAERLLRNIVVTSLPFALVYTYLDRGMSAYNFLSLAGYLTAAHLTMHFIASNLTKVEIQKLIEMRSTYRRNTQRILGTKKANIEMTALYNGIMMPSRLYDLSQSRTHEIPLGFTNVQMSEAKLILVGLYPIARRLVAGYADVLAQQLAASGHPKASEAREDADKMLDEWRMSVFYSVFAPLEMALNTARYGQMIYAGDGISATALAGTLSTDTALILNSPSYQFGRLSGAIAKWIEPEPAMKPGFNPHSLFGRISTRSQATKKWLDSRGVPLSACATYLRNVSEKAQLPLASRLK